MLFGSYAKGNYTVGSDIDLLMVYAGKEQSDAYATVKKLLIYLVLNHIYTQKKNTDKLRTYLTK